MKPMAFLHGWGQSKQVWFQQRQAFADARFINLPGHGGAEDAPAEKWVDMIAAQLPDRPSILVGWSLGGMLALDIAARWPERVAGLALVSATPCFRQRQGWPHGCRDAVFADFEQAVAERSTKIMNRFFALMLHGDSLARSEYNSLARESINRREPATVTGLAAGLSLLAELDLRPRLAGLSMPALIMHGEQDAVVPPGAGLALAEALPHGQGRLFPECGHAPFLTQAQTFNSTLEAWCQKL